MIEQELEEKVLKIVREANVDGFQAYGLWEVCKTGYARALDNASTAVVIVKVASKSFETFGVSEVSMQPVVSLVVRVDSDKTGEKALAFADRLSSRLEKLNMESSLEKLAALETKHFAPGGFMLLPGQGPDYDAQNGTWTYVWQFEVKGTIVQTA